MMILFCIYINKNVITFLLQQKDFQKYKMKIRFYFRCDFVHTPCFTREICFLIQNKKGNMFQL